MSGPFGAGALQFFGGADDFYSHTIDHSLRFEDGDANYLHKTQVSPTLEKKYTISAWIKLGNISAASRMIVGGYDNSTGQFPFYLRSDHKLGFYDSDGVSTYYSLYGNSVLRDPSAWYHVVLNFDSANGTAASRIRMYINGDEETVTGTLPLNRPGYANQSGTILQVGASNNTTSNPFEGYMAEVHFIDGSVLAPTEFAETKAGIWIPKDTSSLTFGSNGFRLKFQDSSALGDDTSGEEHDLTATSGWKTSDQVPDSPTNNWCTINPLNSLIGTLSEGNLKAVTQVSGYGSQVATVGRTSGKWYWEVIPVSNVTGAPLIGVVDETYDALNSGSAVGYLIGNGGVDSIGYYNNGALVVNTGQGNNSYGASYTGDDIIGVALNLDDNEITFYKNNSSQGAFSYTFSDNHIFPAVSDGTGSAAQTFAFNFGQDSSFAGTKTSGSAAASDSNGVGDFYYTPPSGFLALCTANFAAPAIDPAQDEEPADYFNTLLYTGNGTSASDTQAISGVGFQPDWVWIKNRTDAAFHILNDSTRGAGKNLFTNDDAIENTGGSTGDLFTSFDSDGFTVNFEYGGGTNNGTNQNSKAYVAWNWKVNGGTTTNVSAGSSSNIRLIGGGTADQAAVQANTESGISIVSFENTARSSGTFCTFPHGLNSAPNVVWLKSRTSDNYWAIYHSSVSSKLGFLGDSLGGSAFISSTFWNAVNDTTVKFDSSGNLSATDEDIIAYCFQNLDGYFRAGSYHSITGINSSGAFVYTGFRPAWILTKRELGTSSWILTDSKRSPINVVDEALVGQSNASEFEPTGYDIDFLSNGFKIRGTNAALNDTSNTGRRHLYLAYAEQPAKYSNAR